MDMHEKEIKHNTQVMVDMQTNRAHGAPEMQIT